ncbi:hypothetical protein VNO77_06738 [Canavalia gladiata]|uniref:Uncharacterized protein n=1 Tax=Canavalia gladiata TaxID=3824 RepID=A0AAN9MCF9_CANGL
MAKPVPIRPWSRLASLHVAPTPESHTNPQTLLSKPAEPSLKAPQARNTSQHNNAGATNSLPIQSQNLKLTTPHTFPPSKLNAKPQNETNILVAQEPNSVLVNKAIEKPNVNGNGSLLKESAGEIQNQETQVTTKENEMKGKGIDTKLSSSEGCGFRVITIAGENRGAYMQITKSQKKPIHKKENSGSGEVNANMKEKSRKVRTQSSPPLTALYANTNVQCVNNSMVFHASCNYHDPGVHLILSKKPFGKHVDGQRN